MARIENEDEELIECGCSSRLLRIVFCVDFCFGVSTTRRSSHPWRLDLDDIVSEQLLRQIAQNSFPSILLHSELVCTFFFSLKNSFVLYLQSTCQKRA